MGAVNRITSAVFDLVLTPFELLGAELALVLVSGIFGILALAVFKHISWQAGIKGAKGKIKGHMIAIRIYQNDLGIVFSSVIKILFRNFQYLGLNFGPLLPLLVPFTLIAAQLVVRYGFAPLPVVDSEEELAAMLPGQGTLIDVRMKRGRESEVGGLQLRLPPGLNQKSPIVRNISDGIALVEVVATAPVMGVIEFSIDGQVIGTKAVVAGSASARRMQPERVGGFWSSWLWPAEDPFPEESPLERVRFTYPERDLAFLPGGPVGVLLTFFLSSILFGLLALKPLGVQI